MSNPNNLATAIGKEASRIEEDALHSGKGHFNAGTVWSTVHLCLGIPTAILAAWAGIEAFAENPQLTALLALGAAGLSATSTFLNPNEKATNHRNAGREFNALKNKARRFREITLPQTETGSANDEIESLATARDQINSMSPDIPRWAYNKAVKDIDGGKATYAADKEPQ